MHDDVKSGDEMKVFFNEDSGKGVDENVRPPDDKEWAEGAERVDEYVADGKEDRLLPMINLVTGEPEMVRVTVKGPGPEWG